MNRDPSGSSSGLSCKLLVAMDVARASPRRRVGASTRMEWTHGDVQTPWNTGISLACFRIRSWKDVHDDLDVPRGSLLAWPIVAWTHVLGHDRHVVQVVHGRRSDAHFRPHVTTSSQPIVASVPSIGKRKFIRTDPSISPFKVSDRLEGGAGLRPAMAATAVGASVALGKFDAMHIGHRALAEDAARMGRPHLVTFSGMAEVLGWPPRAPLTAVCDRHRVRQLWKKDCDGKDIGEIRIPFGDIRELSPEAFVDLLRDQYNVQGVVAGVNYKFGYRASGDADMLKRLGEERGMDVKILELVTDSANGVGGIISSTRVREAVMVGDILAANALLGRPYRLVVDAPPGVVQSPSSNGSDLVFEAGNALNQLPCSGSYSCTITALENSFPVDIAGCRVLYRQEAIATIDSDGHILFPLKTNFRSGPLAMLYALDFRSNVL